LAASARYKPRGFVGRGFSRDIDATPKRVVIPSAAEESLFASRLLPAFAL
jgi:hypothetical protein